MRTRRCRTPKARPSPQPYVVAASAEALALNDTNECWKWAQEPDIEAAVLSLLAREDDRSHESIPSACGLRRAQRLARGGYVNVRVEAGDGSARFAAAAPFDAILVSAAARLRSSAAYGAVGGRRPPCDPGRGFESPASYENHEDAPALHRAELFSPADSFRSSANSAGADFIAKPTRSRTPKPDAPGNLHRDTGVQRGQPPWPRRLSPRIREYFEDSPGGVCVGDEILVVDDGSTDDTARIAQEWARELPQMRLVSNGTNRGKGYSVKHGMQEARGRIAIFTDADLSSPIEESERLLNALAAGNDIAIGSRALDRSLIFGRQSKFREVAGMIFNAWVRVFTGLAVSGHPVRGFKAVRAGTLHRDLRSTANRALRIRGPSCCFWPSVTDFAPRKSPFAGLTIRARKSTCFAIAC